MSTIQVHQASITTATVQIKTLTVNGKQVTQALFRQLYEVEILDVHTPKLQGIVWGYVNYCSPRCKKYGSGESHRHYIWQKEDLLYTNRLDWSYTYNHSPKIGMFVPQYDNADEYVDTKGEWGTFTKNWNDIQTILKEAPQLFIAV